MQDLMDDVERLDSARVLLDNDVITLHEYRDVINDIRFQRGLEKLDFQRRDR